MARRERRAIIFPKFDCHSERNEVERGILFNYSVNQFLPRSGKPHTLALFFC